MEGTTLLIPPPMAYSSYNSSSIMSSCDIRLSVTQRLSVSLESSAGKIEKEALLVTVFFAGLLLS
jgi:hypothetical protein